MMNCFSKAKEELKNTIFESRIDSAFFNQKILSLLYNKSIKFTASAPFERFTQLKDMIEQRKRWRMIDRQWSYFKTKWKSKSLDTSYRSICTRKNTKRQHKDPLQLDLFEPLDFNFDYKVIVANKSLSAKSTVQFHNGRGSQEAIFGKAKTDAGLCIIPTKRLAGNQIFTLCAMMAHNLSREIQMLAYPRAVRSLPKRPAVWSFEKLDTLRHRLI